MLEDCDATAWLELLGSVTAAPNSLDLRLGSAEQQITVLTGWADQHDMPSAALGRLVAAKWIESDPLSQRGRAGLRREGRTANESMFEPPRSAAGARRIRAALAAGVTALAVAASAGGYALVTSGRGQLVPCASLTPPFQVVRDGAECVGITDGQFPFDPGRSAVSQGITSAERDIAAENARVVRRGHFVTLALLTPLTWSASSQVSLERIRDELEGAYAAQYDANELEGVNPRIRLVLANEGSVEQAWPLVVGQLKKLTAAPGRLVAVIGMGISVRPTFRAAKALSAAGIPMVGAVITADSLDWAHIPGLAKVTPDVRQEVAAITRYLGSRHQLARAFPVSDGDTTDLYTANLAQDFQSAFGKHVVNEEPYGPGQGIGNEFNLIADVVCGIPGPSPLVIYAGREVVLATFIHQLQGSPACDGRRITVVTGSDAVALAPAVTVALPGQAHQPDPAQVSVIYAGIANPAQVSTSFRAMFTTMFGTTGLSDSWMVRTNDALAAVARAISLATGNSAAFPPPSLIRSAIRLLNGPASGARSDRAVLDRHHRRAGRP